MLCGILLPDDNYGHAKLRNEFGIGGEKEARVVGAEAQEG